MSFCGLYCPNVIVFLACGGTWRCEHTLFCVEIVKRHLQILIHSIRQMTVRTEKLKDRQMKVRTEKRRKLKAESEGQTNDCEDRKEKETEGRK